MITTVPEQLVDALAARADAEGLVDVAYRTVDSPAGELLLAATDAGVVKVGFESDEDALEELAARISPRVLQRPARLDTAARQLEEYFAGRRRDFDLPLDMRLAHGFRRHVLDELRDVGYGTTVSYSQLAEAAGNPRAVRAVGSACATNPIPIVIPCHRVLRSDGSLGGYGGGLHVKRALLDLEQRAQPEHRNTGTVLRWLWFGLGWIAVAIGSIGIVVPGLPTTVFFIIAAACFSRSSPRFEQWVLTRPGVGPMVRDYRAGARHAAQGQGGGDHVDRRGVLDSARGCSTAGGARAIVVGLGLVGVAWIAWRVPTKRPSASRSTVRSPERQASAGVAARSRRTAWCTARRSGRRRRAARRGCPAPRPARARARRSRRPPHRRQPVGDDEGRAALERRGQRLLHRGLGLRVEVGGRLVEDHDPRLGQQQPGDRQALALAARQPVAALADHGVETVGQRAHEPRQPGLVERRPQVVVARHRARRSAGWPGSCRGTGGRPGVTTPTVDWIESNDRSRTSTPPRRTAPASTS